MAATVAEAASATVGEAMAVAATVGEALAVVSAVGEAVVVTVAKAATATVVEAVEVTVGEAVAEAVMATVVKAVGSCGRGGGGQRRPCPRRPRWRRRWAAATTGVGISGGRGLPWSR